MTNGSLPLPRSEVNSRPGGALTLAAAAWALGAGSAALAQEEPLDVTLQVLDDVSQIEGVLMPLEEEPGHDPDGDAAPAPESSPPAEPREEGDR